MIDPQSFADRQMELTAEFARYVLRHPEVDAQLPEDAYLYFEVDGEGEFNEYSRHLAERHRREEGRETVCIRVKGLAPPRESRLIEPEILTDASA